MALIYEVFCYSENWHRQLAEMYTCTADDLPVGDSHERMQAICTNWASEPDLWFNGVSWSSAVPEPVERRRARRKKMALFASEITGVLEAHQVYGAHQYSDKQLVGQKVTLKRKNPDFDEIPAIINAVVGSGQFKVWLPEYRMVLLIDRSAFT